MYASLGADVEQVGIWVAGTVLAAGIVAGFAAAWKTARTIFRIGKHFDPPEPGQPDNSLPGRMQRMEDSVVEFKDRLSRHLDEESVAAAALAERLRFIDERDAELFERLAAGNPEIRP